MAQVECAYLFSNAARPSLDYIQLRPARRSEGVVELQGGEARLLCCIEDPHILAAVVVVVEVDDGVAIYVEVLQ